MERPSEQDGSAPVGFKRRWTKVVAAAGRQASLQVGHVGLPKPKQEQEDVRWLLFCCIFITSSLQFTNYLQDPGIIFFPHKYEKLDFLSFFIWQPSPKACQMGHNETGE